MIILTAGDVYHIQSQLNRTCPDTTTTITSEAGAVVGVVCPLSALSGVIVLYAQHQYGRPVIIESQYTDVAVKIQLNPRIRIKG